MERPPPPGRIGSPQLYTPHHIAERILTSRVAMEGERKHVTVLFADLAGSMELLADRDPEQARQILDPVLEAMMAAVHRFEGTVNQVMGDGIMALFGAPLALEDHAVRGCFAALHMQRELRRYAAELQRTRGLDVRIRVGLNSGEVVVRSIGSDLRMDYSAVGVTTHHAARMEQLAEPGTILISAETFRLAEGYVAARTLGAREVKGVKHPVEVFELVGAGAARTRLQASAARGFSPFVGRAREVSALTRAIESTRRGRGQVLAFVGEPGVGKSRLLWEFTRSERTAGCLVVEAGSVSYGKATPYLPVIELLKGHCNLGERDEPEEVRAKIGGHLLALDPALEEGLVPLLALLDQPVDDPAWRRLEPGQQQRRIQEALLRLWLRQAQVQPLILVFEDLHWIDSQTQQLLDRLTERIPAARILLLVNYRPEYVSPWAPKSWFTQVHIQPMGNETADGLLAGLLGDAPTLDELKAMLLERTQGNPLFLEESVRGLAEAGVLAGVRGAHRLARPLTGTEVPPTVQALLASRLDRLAPDDKYLLQSAAVIGKDVPLALLRATADHPDGALEAALARLQAAEFLYEASIFPDVQYTFKHALTHEVAYGSTLESRRRELHARIVEAIERIYAERLGEHVEPLARHAQRGHDWERAARYLTQAGRRCAARSANPDAVAWYEQALEALAELPETRERVAQRLDLLLELRMVLTLVGDLGRAGAVVSEVQQRAHEIGDPLREARALAFMTHLLSLGGDHSRAAAAGHRAIALASGPDGLDARVIARTYLAWVERNRGDYAAALEHCRVTREMLPGELALELFRSTTVPVALANGIAALILAEQGRMVEAEPLALEALDIARRAEHPTTECATLGMLCHLYTRWGRFDDALSVGEEALELLKGSATPFLAAWVKLFVGGAISESGDVSRALPMLIEARRVSLAIGIQATALASAIMLGGALMHAGDHEAAERCALEALEGARAGGVRGLEVWALRLLGDLYVARGPAGLDAARGHYDEALARAIETGSRLEAAHVRFGLGRLAAACGEQGDAQVHLGASIADFQAFGLQAWPERATAAAAALTLVPPAAPA